VTMSAAGQLLSYALGIGTFVLVLSWMGVRPDNFVRWLVSPVGAIFIVTGAALVVWRSRRVRRL
jgi:hypothetical protein